MTSAACSGPAEAIESLTAILAAHSPSSDTGIRHLPDLTTLSVAVTRAKQRYQACRYTEVVSELPPLLTHLQTACAGLEGDAHLQACTLSAEAYQVAGSILLKIGDPGLAWLAVAHGDSGVCPDLRGRWLAGWGPKPSKLVMRVRSPSPALSIRTAARNLA